MKTNELIGPALDWAVAQCEGKVVGMFGDVLRIREFDGTPVFGVEYSPSTDWALGGPIIEREGTFRIIAPRYKGASDYVARLPKDVNDWFEGYGPTPLVAAMRAYVASKLGDEVEIPEDLK